MRDQCAMILMYSLDHDAYLKYNLISAYYLQTLITASASVFFFFFANFKNFGSVDRLDIKIVGRIALSQT